MAKLSLLLFLYHVFRVDKRFRIVAWITGIVLLVWSIVTILMAIFACRPVSASWNLKQYMDPRTVCKPQAYEVLNIYGFCNVVTDVLLIFMPVPLIWNMQTNRRKKIGVALVFATGSLYVSPILRRDATYIDIGSVCAVAIVRQYFAYTHAQVDDPSWEIVKNKIWSKLLKTYAFIRIHETRASISSSPPN